MSNLTLTQMLAAAGWLLNVVAVIASWIAGVPAIDYIQLSMLWLIIYHVGGKK